MPQRHSIIDTNVVVAGIISSPSSSPPARVLDAMLDGRLLFLLSPALLHEYRQVLLRPKLLRLHGLTEDQLDQLLTELTANAVWREPARHNASGAPDPGDDHLWALLAEDTDAILVTGDQLLIDKPRQSSLSISVAECGRLLG